MQINTGRGRYRLRAAGAPERLSDALVLTLVLERDDGVERVAFRCRVASGLLAGNAGSVDTDSVLDRLAPWIEREFEQTRELALKSIRAERSLLELGFDQGNPGPF